MRSNNDILQRNGAVPEPAILPVSAVITGDTDERRSDDRVRDEVSGPLMQEAREYITIASTQTTYPDSTVRVAAKFRIYHHGACLKKNVTL